MAYSSSKMQNADRKRARSPLETNLCSLCRSNQWEKVMNMLVYDQNIALLPIKMDNNNSTTILHQVITTRSPDTDARFGIIQRILANTPSAAGIRNGFGSLALHVVAQRNIKMDAATKEKVILALIDAYPDALLAEGGVGKRTPLHIVFTDYTSSTVVKRMIEMGRNATLLKDKKGWLPIHVAASRHCSPEKIQMLLDACPKSLFAKTDEGETPLQLAVSTATRTHPNHTLIKHLITAEAKAAKDSSDEEKNYEPINKECQKRNVVTNSEKRRRSETSYPRASDSKRRVNRKSPNKKDLDIRETPSSSSFGSNSASVDRDNVEVLPQTGTPYSEEEKQQAMTLLLLRQVDDKSQRPKIDRNFIRDFTSSYLEPSHRFGGHSSYHGVRFGDVRRTFHQTAQVNPPHLQNSQYSTFATDEIQRRSNFVIESAHPQVLRTPLTSTALMSPLVKFHRQPNHHPQTFSNNGYDPHPRRPVCFIPPQSLVTAPPVFRTEERARKFERHMEVPGNYVTPRREDPNSQNHAGSRLSKPSSNIVQWYKPYMGDCA